MHIIGDMGELSDWTEKAAAAYLERILRIKAVPYDTGKRNGAVDFELQRDGTYCGALEVTQLLPPDSEEWMGLAEQDGWQWPASGLWSFRATEATFRYKWARETSIRATALCNQHGVVEPRQLPQSLLDADRNLARLASGEHGELRKVAEGSGIDIHYQTVAQWVTGEPHEKFISALREWRTWSHIDAHVKKIATHPKGGNRHLFLFISPQLLPCEVFNDNWNLPSDQLSNFEGVDTIWFWSSFWHRVLRFHQGAWCWLSTEGRDTPEEWRKHQRSAATTMSSGTPGG